MNQFYKESEYIHNRPLVTISKMIRDFCESSDDTLFIRNNSKITNMISKSYSNVVFVEDAADANVSSRLSAIIDDLYSINESSVMNNSVRLCLEKSCDDINDLEKIIESLTTVLESCDNPQMTEFILTEVIPFKIDDYENSYLESVMEKTKYMGITWKAFINAASDEKYESACRNIKLFAEPMALSEKFKDICCKHFFEAGYTDVLPNIDGVQVGNLPTIHMKEYSKDILDNIKNISVEDVLDKVNINESTYLPSCTAKYSIPINDLIQFIVESNYDNFSQVTFENAIDGSQTRVLVEDNNKVYVMAEYKESKDSHSIVLIEATNDDYSVIIEDFRDTNEYKFIED